MPEQFGSKMVIVCFVNYCWLIQQTSSNSLLWSPKYFWWGC